MLNTKQKCWKNQAIPSASFFVQKDNGGVCICFDPFFFVNYVSLVVLQDKVYFFVRFGLPQGGKIMFLKVVPYRQARSHVLLLSGRILSSGEKGETQNSEKLWLSFRKAGGLLKSRLSLATASQRRHLIKSDNGFDHRICYQRGQEPSF